ncbi:phosphate ABC transporter substrate-binding protein PstS [Lipingzhangella sp. LS1_29]|uniref:Phosphate-binding protein n=1 Tax=Lipingzhangella rawalii TaxID=2055835 RepID=A0ABU2H0Q5_9ACTN|nr:phosphate ABC transporter substrate-binding protein PstS [Lipingzhangella rawalii]MDS1268888.1 phosphate ABC transporter substrate-binding protein PstS [Lipingzhangella rawalii]
MRRSDVTKGISVALCAALTVTACGTDQAAPEDERVPVPEDLACPPGSISGAGSSAQELAMQVWLAGYQTACTDSTIYYDAIGSGGGRSQFIDGAVTFAGSDDALVGGEREEAVERCGGSDILNLPVYVVPIAVVFNLDGIDELNLSPQTIAGIFNQDITRWDAPEIAADNPETDLPDLPIQPVSRSDESGTTKNFTNYLEVAATESWPHAADGQWPIPPVEAGQGNSGVAQAVEAGNGTIGYVEASHIGDMDSAHIGVDGEYVAPDPQAAAAVLETSQRVDSSHEHDHMLELDYGTTAEGAYPIVLATYEIVCTEYEDPDEVELLQAFLDYTVSEVGQEAVSAEVGSAPIPEDLQTDLQEAIAAIESR